MFKRIITETLCLILVAIIGIFVATLWHIHADYQKAIDDCGAELGTTCYVTVNTK